MTPEEFEQVRTIFTAAAVVIIEVAGYRHMIDPKLVQDFARHAAYKTPEPE